MECGTCLDFIVDVYLDNIRQEVFGAEYDAMALEMVTVAHVKEMGIMSITMANWTQDEGGTVKAVVGRAYSCCTTNFKASMMYCE